MPFDISTIPLVTVNLSWLSVNVFVLNANVPPVNSVLALVIVPPKVVTPVPFTVMEFPEPAMLPSTYALFKPIVASLVVAVIRFLPVVELSVSFTSCRFKAFESASNTKPVLPFKSTVDLAVSEVTPIIFTVFLVEPKSSLTVYVSSALVVLKFFVSFVVSWFTNFKVSPADSFVISDSSLVAVTDLSIFSITPILSFVVLVVVSPIPFPVAVTVSVISFTVVLSFSNLSDQDVSCDTVAYFVISSLITFSSTVVVFEFSTIFNISASKAELNANCTGFFVNQL